MCFLRVKKDMVLHFVYILHSQIFLEVNQKTKTTVFVFISV